MIILVAWFLVVLFFYFRQTDSLFEYVSFVIKHRGSFSLWHMYSLKALGSLALAAWIIWIAIQYGGRLLAKIAPACSMSRLEQRVFSAGLGFGVISFATFALGALRLWYAAVFWLLLIVATGAALYERRGGLIPLLLRRGVRATKEWPRSEKARTGWSLASHLRVSDHPVCGASVASRPFIDAAATPPQEEGNARTELRFTLRIAWGLLIVTAAIFLLGDLSPEVFYDSLHYHLGVPNLYLINHRIYDQPNLLFSSFVMTPDLVWGFALTVGNEITAKLLHGGTALLLVLAFLAFEHRYLTRGAGLLGAVLFLSTPLVGMNVITAGTDVAVTALQFLAAFALVRALADAPEEPAAQQWLRLAGICTGLAASSKYTSMPAIPLGCIMIVWWKRWRLRQEWKAIVKQLALFTIPAVLIVGPYFVKNVVFHHNPIYPFAGTFWGQPRLTSQSWQTIANEDQARRIEDFTNIHSLVRVASHPWSVTMNGRTSQDFTGPLLLGLLPITLFARPPGKAYGLLARYCLGLCAVWFLTSSIPRFAMPVLALASIVVAQALLSSNAALWQRTILVLCLVIAATNLYFTLVLNANSENWRVLFGQVSERGYLSDAHPTYPYPSYEAFEWMNEHLPAGSKVLMAGDSRSLYTRVPMMPSSIYDSQVIIEIARRAGSGDEMARLLRDQGITHIFINFGEAVRTESYGVFDWDTHGWAVLEDFWSRYPELIFVDYRPNPTNLKGLFVFRLRSDGELRQAVAPSTNPFVRWKPK